MSDLGKTVAEPVRSTEQLDFHALNAMLNLYDENGKIQFEKDREAANQFFLQHVNQNTVFFHDLEEKFDYLIKNNYYNGDIVEKYDFSDIKDLFKHAYSYKFRFKTFLGAYKYYTSYTLRTFDGNRYLERYEDRVCMVALGLADGDISLARRLVDEIIQGRFQPDRLSSISVKLSAVNRFPVSFFVSKIIWSQLAGRSILLCSCLSVAAE